MQMMQKMSWDHRVSEPATARDSAIVEALVMLSALCRFVPMYFCVAFAANLDHFHVAWEMK
jgi:hypothetical protein